MKKTISIFLCTVMMFSFFIFDTSAINEAEDVHRVTYFAVTGSDDAELTEEAEMRATGLIVAYGLSISVTGTTLKLNGQTRGSTEVVKVGFKNLIVQRRRTSSESWEDYYEYGNVYIDDFFANLSTSLTVASGYQYRISCKHYAKKNILSVQTISNTSNVVVV